MASKAVTTAKVTTTTGSLYSEVNNLADPLREIADTFTALGTPDAGGIADLPISFPGSRIWLTGADGFYVA